METVMPGSPLKELTDVPQTNGTSESYLNHKVSSSKSKSHTSSSSSSKDRKHGHEHRHRSSDSKHKHSSSSSSRHHHSNSHKHSSSSHRHRDDRKREHGSSGSKPKSSSSAGDSTKHRDEPVIERSVKVESDCAAGEPVHNHVSAMHESPIKSPSRADPFVSLVPVKNESPVKVPHMAATSPQNSPSYGSSPVRSRIGSPTKTESPIESGSPHEMDTHVKQEVDSDDDDMPLNERSYTQSITPVKRQLESDDEDDAPLSARAEKVAEKKVKLDVKKEKRDKADTKKRKVDNDDDDDDEFKPVMSKKKVKVEKGKDKKRDSKGTTKKDANKGVKDEKAKLKKEKEAEEEQQKWRWWEEERKDDGTKWKFLEHKGPVFAPLYECLPKSVRFYYDGERMELAEETEEVATFYARMLDHDYTTHELFNKNFFKDWRKVMTLEEKQKITDLSKCNFKEMHAHFLKLTEERKNRTKEEKQAIKETNEKLIAEYGFCIIDHHREKIGNFRIEPPSLFRGRGDHPKQGMLKKRVQPEDVIINCSKDAKVPDPPAGHKWKEVRHSNDVTWLACWTENVQGSTKYVMLNAASRLKGEKDWQKYETARKLHKHVDRIRAQYRQDWKSKEMRVRQRAVAMYFIDKLALRAGNEKDEEQADTVGCCSLRVEHLKLHEKMGNEECVVEFDFLGKDSIRYYNKVSVEKRVFKNLILFTDNKQGSDDIFDRLNTAILNKHLTSLMDGLTAKVFRTYNASITLSQQLELLTNADDPVPAKMLSYNRANRAVAVLCNHQRAVPKNFSKQMDNLQTKIDAKKVAIKDAKKDVKAAKSDMKNMKTDKSRKLYESKKKLVDRLQEQLTKLEVQATDKDENKEIALGTSKLNYLDPRISVAWCKKFDVPLEKIYNKTQRDKFAWAVDMADENFIF